MGRFVKGDVVVAPFPFSDLSRAKRRPALVIATLTCKERVKSALDSPSDSFQFLDPFSEFAVGAGFLPCSFNYRADRTVIIDAEHSQSLRRPIKAS